MTDALDKPRLFIREFTGPLRAAYNYDVLDPDSGERLLTCREQSIRPLTKLLRFTDLKRSTAFDLLVARPDGVAVMRVTRRTALLRSRVQVLDPEGDLLGGFLLKPFSISGAFDVVDATGVPVCRLAGNLTGWVFRFLGPDNVELGRVTKRWAGVGKELISGASDYVLDVDAAVPPGGTTRHLILASVFCIAMVLKINA